MLKKIKYLVLGDLHLGHSNNKTEEIVNNLKYYFLINNKLFKTLDIIYLAGDVYDKLLVNNSTEFILAIEWLTELLIYCKANSIKLRILEGTPSHDWKQSKVITSIITKLNIQVDFKYIDTLHIEKMDDLNLSILYVPDEYKHKASETYNEVLELLKENHLSKVDIAIMHGQFNYQIPMVKLESSHNEIDYMNIVNHYISIAHIHTASVYDRILAQGSFDRLAHNEEEDKGGIVITLFPNGHREYIFIKNIKAKIFKTFRFKEETLEEMLIYLDTIIPKLPIGSYVRLITNPEIAISKNIKAIKDRYIGYVVKTEIDNKKNLSVGENILSESTISDTYAITVMNIEDLLLEEIMSNNLTLKEIGIFKSELSLAVANI